MRAGLFGFLADTVSGRIWRVAAGVLVTVLAVGAGATVALLISAHQVDRLSSGYAPAADSNGAALTYMLGAETGIRGYALSGRRSALAPYRQAVAKVFPRLDAAAAALHGIGDHSLDRAIATERRAAQAWITAVARASVRGLSAARRTTQTAGARKPFDAFRRANDALAGDLAAKRDSLRSDTENLTGLIYPLVIAGVVLAALGSCLAAFRTARGVSRPLTALWDTVRRLEGGDLSVRADETAGPAEVRAVSAALNGLAVERDQGVAVGRRDDTLRRETRELTSAIRIGQDPRTIARTLVAGLGRVFEVDVVWLATFADSRVPAVSDIWRRSGPSGPDSCEDTDELMQRALANRLWHGASVIGIPDHRVAGGAAIAPAPQVGGVRASAVAAIGEGNSAMGLLWLAMAVDVRTWTSTELGLLQHVSGELAQSLVQNNVLAQQREAMRRLREADEAKTALVSTVSHELRTPLTSILGYVDVLLDTYGAELDDELVTMLRAIERNGARLHDMIEALLTQSAAEAGRRIVRLERTDLAHVLEDVRETITPLATNARLDLEFTGPAPGSAVVDGDTRELTQALVNLAANAVKFTGAGGTVRVSAHADGEQAVLRVADTGMGIPADEMPHLFERFFRARNARSAVIPGTGLGLSIVADIVSRHRGTVDVESELGRGTAFVVHLPLAAD
ncbi:MAG: ATP-binding protein [Jatrophihabitantaceae bacterium]